MGYKIIQLAEIDGKTSAVIMAYAEADVGALPEYEDGSVCYISDNPDKLYVKEGGEWTLINKTILPPGPHIDLDGVNPHQLMISNLLFARRSEMNEVAAGADTWARAVHYVRNGKGPQMFPLGSKLRTAHETYGDVLWTVVGHDHDANPLNPSGHTMRLSMTPVIYGRQVSATQALVFCASPLAAGTYHFALPAGYDVAYGGGKSIQFTLAQPVPANGQIMFPWGHNTQSTDTKIATYASSTSTTAIESNVSVSEGTGGTDLGTADGLTANMNHIHRARYGNNHYGQSALRRWLTSALAANAWWAPQTKYDRPPSYANAAGFLAGFDSDFLDALLPVDITVITNPVYEEGTTINSSYVLRDKMFLPSMTEVNLGKNNNISEGALLDYWDGSANADRIKFDITNPATARYWFLRSPLPSDANTVRTVYSDGSLSNGSANNGHGAAPDCVIG